MAVTFSKSLSTTKLLNAYNNNVVEFTSNAIPIGETISKATINIGGEDVEITPINEVFSYNFREIIRVLMNNNFEDSIIADDGYKADASLSGSYLVTYTLTFSDATTENTAETYVFLKSVEQIAGVSERLLTEQHILNQSELTFFDGYPFDISIYSDGDFSVINDDNNNYAEFDGTLGETGRIYLSELDAEGLFRERVEFDGGVYEGGGCDEADSDGDLLELGCNNVRVVGGVTDSMTIKLESVCGGIYLKWFNRMGGWSYWLFNPIYKELLKARTMDKFSVDFESIDDTYETTLITGKDTEKERGLVYENLSEAERLQITDLLSSPRVEMYNGVKDGDLSTWQTVVVKDGGFEINNTKRCISNFRATIEINDYNQN